MVITVGVILCVALAGLFVVNVDPANADRSSLATLADGPNQLVVDGASSPEPTGSMTGAVIKMISALAVVIVAVYVGLYFLRKLMGSKAASGGRRDILDVIQTTYVGQHKAIALVRVAHRSVLVGVTDNQITTLTELTEDETAEILAESPVNRQPVDRFAGILRAAGDRLRQMSMKKNQAALES